MKSDKVYVVTSGSYSDYRIECVFSTREKAEEYLQYHDDEYRIEKYAIDEEFVRNEGEWRVAIDLTDDDVQVDKFLPISGEGSKWLNSMWLYKSRFYTHVRTDTRDRAIRIARERLAAARSNEVIWLRLQIRDDYGEYPIYNCYTNELVK